MQGAVMSLWLSFNGREVGLKLLSRSNDTEEKVTGPCRKLHSKEVHNYYSLCDIRTVK